MKDKKVIKHTVNDQVGPSEIEVVEFSKWVITAVDDVIHVEELDYAALKTELPIDVFDDQTDEVPDSTWVGKTVKLVRRQVTKPIEWESWEL